MRVFIAKLEAKNSSALKSLRILASFILLLGLFYNGSAHAHEIDESHHHHGSASVEVQEAHEHDSSEVDGVHHHSPNSSENCCHNEGGAGAPSHEHHCHHLHVLGVIPENKTLEHLQSVEVIQNSSTSDPSIGALQKHYRPPCLV